MKLKLPILYKKLLILALVLGPIFWLVFTEDGQRRTDTVLLMLWGEDEIKFNLKDLDDNYTEAELKTVYPDLDWQCQDQSSDFGDRLCVTRIGVFNGIPARYLTLFFRAGKVSAVKMVYREIYHPQLLTHLHRHLGKPAEERAISQAQPQPTSLIHWRTGQGVVVIKKQLQKGEEAALLWLSAALTTQHYPTAPSHARVK
ncbi:hypothetical protein [endosymbiont of Ridgeia piscesae]|jgi:hypothetical protein|uniref:Uncharacterized protein n=1 Tax=endosymbiont of Ridgeia piscesae TaxID=54398 RepID=A0A0T5Z854_9GAMM|nr:hypothetical protein [endosymbiont of Ridgeia piscesae]KRT55262.1 hypothetical protein Ga0074115_11620 [endosymbiont of Ridgeia piscesae]KRT59024.1 hypothetical protein Ga0076813_14649 [endosymbiont of Ridgeia piscesae]